MKRLLEIESELREWASRTIGARAAVRFLDMSEVGTGDKREAEELLAQLSEVERTRFGAITSEERRRSWLSARWAERSLRGELGPGAILSISHSSYGAIERLIALGFPREAGVGGLGVDLEHKERQVSKEVLERVTVSAEREKCKGLSAVEVWTVKEAVFKANSANEGTTLSGYRVVSLDLSSLSGNAEFPVDMGRASFSLYECDGWIYASAWTRTQP